MVRRLLRASFLGALAGAVLAASIAVVEFWLAVRHAPGARIDAEIVLFGAAMYAAVGLVPGALGGLAVGFLTGRRGPTGGPPIRQAPRRARDSRAMTRRAVLRVGATAASMGALAAFALARNVQQSRAQTAQTPDRQERQPPQPTPSRVPTEVPIVPATTPPVGAPVVPPTPTPAPRTDGPPNVLLITMDTVRADQLGAYGHPFVKTPAIDNLAAQGARFDMHVVQQPQTNPSHASILTGMYPSSSGVRVHMVDKIPTSLETLATALGRAGYATGALYSWMSMDPQYCGFERGFATYRNVAPDPGAVPDNPAAKQAAADYRAAREYLSLPKAISQATNQEILEETAKGRADLTTDAAIAQLQALKGEPFFLWVHYFDPHYPYMPPGDLADQYDPGYRGPIDSSIKTVDAIEQGRLTPQGEDLRRLVSLYQAEITFLDVHLSRLLATLDDLGLSGMTVLALTADHGEAFGEHTQETDNGDFFHPHSLYNTEQRTPLIMRYPARIRPGTVVAAPTQAIDLFPTLLELAGVPVPQQSQGNSLVPLLEGRDDGSARAAYSAMHDTTFTSVTVPGWKYIQNNASGHRQLYDLSADRDEVHDVSDAHTDMTQRLAAQTAGWMKAVGL